MHIAALPRTPPEVWAGETILYVWSGPQTNATVSDSKWLLPDYKVTFNKILWVLLYLVIQRK